MALHAYRLDLPTKLSRFTTMFSMYIRIQHSFSLTVERTNQTHMPYIHWVRSPLLTGVVQRLGNWFPPFADWSSWAIALEIDLCAWNATVVSMSGATSHCPVQLVFHKYVAWCGRLQQWFTLGPHTVSLTLLSLDANDCSAASRCT